jgi:hypothetical protein
MLCSNAVSPYDDDYDPNHDSPLVERFYYFASKVFVGVPKVLQSGWAGCKGSHQWWGVE